MSEDIPGRKISKRYDPPIVRSDYNAVWHARGICNYLKETGATALSRTLISMITSAIRREK